jgi:DNA-directed RNA polymerase specialized sigma24 family protein
MNLQKSSIRAIGTNDDIYNRIFTELPPLGSPDYMMMLETVSAGELPAQVLARAFRQLVVSGSEAAANKTLVRLVASKKYGYLSAVYHLASQMVTKGQYRYDKEDLIQETISEIVKTLPTPRGELAEKAWVLFSKQRFQDGWRNLNGRRGEKLRGKRVEPTTDEETGDVFDPAEETDGQSAPWHASVEKSKLPWLESFIRRTVLEIADPTIRHVAEDQFSDDPSPISAGKSVSGKPPLTAQLGLSRFQISRALKNAKARLAAALMTQREQEIEIDWLRQFLKD